MASILNSNWVFASKLEEAIKENSVYGKGLILDIGCGNKPYERYFLPNSERYIGIDLPFSPLIKENGADVFASGTMLPFRSDTFDTVLCFEVLDDIPEPHHLFKEFSRVMKRGAYLILSAPQMWELHNQPYDYYRFTRYGLEHLSRANGFTVEKMEGVGGFWSRMAAKFFRLLQKFFPNQFLRKMMFVFLIPFQLIFYFLDSIFFSKKDVVANVMVASKGASQPTQKM